MEPSKRQRQQDAETVQELVMVVSTSFNEDLDDSTKAALGHTAGCFSHSVTKRCKCESCTELLTDQNSPLLEIRLDDTLDKVPAIYACLTALLDRGRLTRPSSTAVDVTHRICWVWRTIVRGEESRRCLFDCHLPGALFADVVAQVSISVAISAKSNDASGITCSNGHVCSVLRMSWKGWPEHSSASSSVTWSGI